MSNGRETASQFSNGFDLQRSIKRESAKMGADKIINPLHVSFKRRTIREQN